MGKKKPTIDEMVGARIREKRNEKNMKLTEVAAGIGRSEGQMSRIETGIYSTSPELLAKLAAIFGCPISFFTQDIEKTR